ncbi:MAG: urease accessory protein UreE [Pseudomonadota bacterium]
MLTARETVPAGEMSAAGADHTITLTREDRYRRRIRCTTDGGVDFLLDLPEATYLAHGTGLRLSDGAAVVVNAAEEKLLEVTAEAPGSLMRLAWHIGNRHTPAEISGDALFIQHDHVLAEMLRGLGATVRDVVRPFEPEGGAYGGHGSLHASHHVHHGHQDHAEHHARDDHHDHHDGTHVGTTARAPGS